MLVEEGQWIIMGYLEPVLRSDHLDESKESSSDEKESLENLSGSVQKS